MIDKPNSNLNHFKFKIFSDSWVRKFYITHLLKLLTLLSKTRNCQNLGRIISYT